MDSSLEVPMKIALATHRQGILTLTSEDGYLMALKNWEYKVKTDGKAKDIDRFRTFLAKQVLPWDAEEEERLCKIIGALNHKMDKLKSAIVADTLKSIFVIKTTGLDEWRSAYTRENAIILPVNKLETYGDLALEKLLAHEVFHVLSRFNEPLRKRLYELLGYEKVQIDWKAHEISKRILVNPDALDTTWALVDKDRENVNWTIPIIFLREGHSDFQAQDISDRIAFKLYTLHPNQRQGVIQEVEAVKDFKNRFGAYGFMGHHPEEVLAEAFVSWMYGLDHRPFIESDWFEAFCQTLSSN